MKKQTIALSLGIGAMFLATQHAFGQTARNCADRDIVISRLAEGYGETRQALGVAANNSIVEVFASDETGTWTILISSASGVACMVASGEAFEALAELPQPSGLKL